MLSAGWSLDQSFNVVRRGIEEDPFGDLDGSDDMEQADSQELRSLADQLHIPEPGSLVEMASADCDVPIYSELDNEKWEEDFWAAPYIVFTFAGSVRNVWNDVYIYIYIYIYIYVNNMADF